MASTIQSNTGVAKILRFTSDGIEGDVINAKKLDGYTKDYYLQAKGGITQVGGTLIFGPNAKIKIGGLTIKGKENNSGILIGIE